MSAAIFQALSQAQSAKLETPISGKGREWLNMIIEVMEFMAEGYLP